MPRSNGFPGEQAARWWFKARRWHMFRHTPPTVVRHVNGAPAVSYCGNGGFPDFTGYQEHLGRHEYRACEVKEASVGACDPQNANRYVAMLRRALVVGGLFQIIFIAQQEQVWRQADVILRFENGSVEVGG